MEQVEIEIERREAVGSAANRRIRKQGLIPSVVYSHGEQSVTATVPTKEFIRIAKVTKSSQIFTLKSKDKALNGKSAVVKEVQKDYLNGLVLHVDFQAIRDDEELTVLVPIRVVGEAPGVKVDGGILTVVAHEIPVRCLPKQIPSDVPVDVSELHIGDSIHADKLVLSAGVRLAGNPNETIVSIVTIRIVAEEEAAATTAVAGAAAPGAEAGAAPAAGAAAPAAEGGEKDAKAATAKDKDGAKKEGKKKE